jgi:uncharacterized membrane protein YgcG
VAVGEAFTDEQRERIERARRSAEESSGLRFWVRVGNFSGDYRIEAERLLANLTETPRSGGVLILVGPGERRLEIMTTPGAKRRLSDATVGLAVLTMTSSFGVGDLVGGLVNGLRQLADAAGRAPEGTQGQPGEDQQRLSGRAPIAERGLEHSGGEALSHPVPAPSD